MCVKPASKCIKCCAAELNIKRHKRHAGFKIRVWGWGFFPSGEKWGGPHPGPPRLPGGGAAGEPRPSLIPLYYKRVKGDGLDFIEVQRHHIFTFFFLWGSLPPLHPPARLGKPLAMAIWGVLPLNTSRPPKKPGAGPSPRPAAHVTLPIGARCRDTYVSTLFCLYAPPLWYPKHLRCPPPVLRQPLLPPSPEH